MFRSIRTSLIVLLAGIILFTVGVSSTVLNAFVKKPLLLNAEDALRRSAQITQSILNERRKRMRDQVRLVGVLPILVTVIEQGNRLTILDSARSYQRDLDLQVLDVFNDVGKLIASGEGFGEAVIDNPQVRYLIQSALRQGKMADTFTLRNNRLALLAASGVGLHDEPSGGLLAGLYLDDAFANEIKALTKSDVSFVAGGRVLGSTLPDQEQDRDLARIATAFSNTLATNAAATSTTLDTKDHLFQIRPIRDFAGEVIGLLVVQQSLSGLKAVLSGVRNLLVSIGLIVILVSIVIGIFFASQTVVGPITRLRTSASELAHGNLDADIDVGRKDELGSLARSFANMRDAIKENIRQLNALNAAFERFVPKEFLGYLERQSIVDVNLGDSVKRSFTILFSDIRSFTTLSESMSPTDVFLLLNAYLKRMNPMIQSHHGFIDKYIGDAIMALFGDSPDDAVRGSIGMIEALHVWNQERKRAGYLPIEIGIGVNTGEVMLGTLGSPSRMEGSVISDAVNLASRIEGLTKEYGCRILIGENTYRNLKSPDAYKVRYIDSVKVKGKADVTAVYEIYDADLPDVRDLKDKIKKPFEEACRHFQAHRFAEARKIFEECLKVFPGDKAAKSYVSRAEDFEKHGVDENWNVKKNK